MLSNTNNMKELLLVEIPQNDFPIPISSIAVRQIEYFDQLAYPADMENNLSEY